jgi:hypothetical protein
VRLLYGVGPTFSGSAKQSWNKKQTKQKFINQKPPKKKKEKRTRCCRCCSAAAASACEGGEGRRVLSSSLSRNVTTRGQRPTNHRTWKSSSRLLFV